MVAATLLARPFRRSANSCAEIGRGLPWSSRAPELALCDRVLAQARGEFTADSRVTALAEAWYAGLSDLSPITMQAYRDRLDRQLLPRLGALRIRELTVGTLLRGIADQHGTATARMCHSVLSGMCTLAARHDALRIGEARGLVWNAVDLEVGTVEVRAAAVRVRGQGLVVKATKTDTGRRTLLLPHWCTAMLRDRAERSAATDADRSARPVFPAPLGG
ncbi:hypothetical protein ACI782_19110 [Geodermatophilus sp. SYSU D00703]